MAVSLLFDQLGGAMLLSRRVAALLIAIAAVLPLSGSRRAPNHQPDLVLWAWERPEDLRSAEPNHVEIAYLAETLTVGRSGLGVHHRMQPLRVAPLTQVIATVRLESGSGADLGAATRERVVQELATVAGLPRVSGLQIDF
ncbi:MAG TPA: hypothetical protein VE998_12865, partial [Terriglobales bacterium]|nr:hypothetical protein [Terriglobales bacterium]